MEQNFELPFEVFECLLESGVLSYQFPKLDEKQPHFIISQPALGPLEDRRISQLLENASPCLLCLIVKDRFYGKTNAKERWIELSLPIHLIVLLVVDVIDIPAEFH